jgi:tRNA nucleotidyltransferase (CCA-adding enzyme)
MSPAAAPATAAAELEAKVLARVTPTPDEERAVAKDAGDLVAALHTALSEEAVPGRATVQGSVAKGTWLAGGADLDVFLLLDPSVPAERLERTVLKVGPTVLDGAQKRYAQHPYLVGSFRGRAVDLVPAYAVKEAAAKMSAVDRTPFHTDWVKRTLDTEARAQVRLAKRWLKGVGAYGAQTAVGGFSGYLVEVLVARFGTFHGLLAWLAADAKPRRIALGADAVKDEVAPLVVVDPVDPARNCAAAVSAEVLELARDAARAYGAAPTERFFFPAPPREEPPAALAAHQANEKEAWQALALRPRTDRLDIVFPQFQKAARAIAAHLEAEGFPVRRLRAHADEAAPAVLLEWVAQDVTLPARRTHKGPLASIAPNAERFAAKYADHPDALGPVRTGADGKLEVDLAVHHRTASARLAADLAALPLGKHVADAMADARHWTDPRQADAAWRPAIADTVLDRRPWQR